MTLPAGCFPCPPIVAHAARHVLHHGRRLAHHVTRPLHRPARHLVHLALRHPGKIVIGVCCAGALGPIGGALPTPPASLPVAIYAPPGTVSGAPATTAAWPEIPNYSGGYGVGPGGIYGIGAATGSNAPALIPVYGQTPAPQLLDVAPPIGGTHGAPPIKTTSVPEPASALLLFAPIAGLAILRRVRA